MEMYPGNKHALNSSRCAQPSRLFIRGIFAYMYSPTMFSTRLAQQHSHITNMQSNIMLNNDRGGSSGGSLAI